jgi:hypothetical protein
VEIIDSLQEEQDEHGKAVETRKPPYKNIKNSYKKKQWRPLSKKKKRGKNLSPRNRKACHSVGTSALPS